MEVSNKRSSKPEAVEKIAEDLSAENTSDSPVVEALRLQVANAFVLYANHKHYHWQTYGPLFRDLHKLFDTFAEEVLESLDPLAERVRMIGQDPPAHPIEVMDLATASPAAPHSSMHDMVQEARSNALVIIKEMREGAKLAEEHDDPGTVDLFSKLVQVHEKQEWWLRDILRKRDGLTSMP
jgi:starvation-inducible DNA-binding protein